MRVVDTDAPSHIHRNTVAVLPSAEEEKYNSAAEARRASFTPFVVSTDGMRLGREANFLLCNIKRLAQSISIKWDKPLRQTTGWLCAMLSFAILQATNLCLRGSRTKWRSGVGIDDGAGITNLINTFLLLCHFVVMVFSFFITILSNLLILGSCAHSTCTCIVVVFIKLPKVC